MSQALLEPATIDLMKSRLDRDSLVKLARQLGLSFDRLEPYVPAPSAHDNDWLREIVRDALRLALTTQGELDRLHAERLANVRIFFETVMAWEIADNTPKRQKLIEMLLPIHERMLELAQSAKSDAAQPDAPDSDAAALDETVAEELWRLDGEFHQALCHVTKRPDLAKVVDVVLERLKGVGMASSLAEVRETCDEHEQLIAEYRADEPDPERLFEAIAEHVGRAKERWLAKEGGMERVSQQDQRSELWLSHLRDSLDPALALAEEAFAAQLPELLRQSPGQWVAFHGRQLVAVGATQSQVFHKCSGLPGGQVIIRKVTPQVREEDLIAS